MKDVLVRAGSSLLAAAIGYIVLNLLTEGWGLAVKIGLAIAIGIVAFVIAVWASSESPTKPSRSINVATSVKGKSADIEDIHVGTKSAQQTNVASDINVSDEVKIKGVRINATKDSK